MKTTLDIEIWNNQIKLERLTTLLKVAEQRQQALQESIINDNESGIRNWSILLKWTLRDIKSISAEIELNFVTN
jgi:hypothetical protein